MKTVLDDDLRERWTVQQEGAGMLSQARAELARRLGEEDDTPQGRSHVGRAYQRLSEACRFSDLLEESVEHKDSAIEIWREQNKVRASFLVRLQRALVLAELADERAADLMATLDSELRADANLEPYYRDFWLEYEARRLLWTGDRAGAEQRLIEALEFRIQHRAARIVEWTEGALRKVHSGRESV